MKLFGISRWLIKAIAPIVKEAIKEAAPVIKEVATEAAKAYVNGEMQKLSNK